MNRSLLTAAALAGLVALTGCAELGYLGGNGGYGDYRRGSDDRYEDYGYRGDYERRINRDASAYANELDRYLRISNSEERAIRDLLVRRTYETLDRGGAYPFPRRGDHARSFWGRVDRDIERVLDRRYHEPYRYYNRYGAQRYQDYYRYRRYDARRGWYDTRRRDDDRYDDGQRERARDRRDDRREAGRREDRQEARRDRRENQREARRDRRENQREARRDQREDRREARQDRREGTRRAAEQTRERRQEQRRRDRRGGNDD